MVKDYEGVYILKSDKTLPIIVSENTFSIPYGCVYGSILRGVGKETLDKHYRIISRMVSW